MGDVLFEIKEENLDTGLRNVPVGRCITSKVDPVEGLTYSGYAIAELADRDPEEIIYLLFRGDLPNAAELKLFKSELAAQAKLPHEVIGHLRSLPRAGHPMKWFLSGINFMGMVMAEADYKKSMKKRVVAFLGGWAAPKGKRMGHAGAIVGGEDDTAQSKAEKLKAVGIPVASTFEQIVEILKKRK